MFTEVSKGKEAAKSRLVFLSIKRTALGMAQALGLRRLQDYLQGSRILSNSPVWMLGVCYDAGKDGENHDMLPEEVQQGILEDFASRLWMTYRWGFCSLGVAGLSSDVGWGCTLRSGQMMLAQAVLHHVFGRHWRRLHDGGDYSNSRDLVDILCKFSDNFKGALSIHNICKAGEKYGVVAGEWLGPWVLSHVLRDLVNTHEPYGLKVLLISQPGGGAPYINKARMNEYFAAFQDITAEGRDQSQQNIPSTLKSAQCPNISLTSSVATSTVQKEKGYMSSKRNDSGTDWELADVVPCPVLCAVGVIVLIPLVLGDGKVDPRYLSQLKILMEWPQSLGIIGGRPSASLYFIGYQDENVIYLDPHAPQEVSDGEDTSSYFCHELRHMPIGSVDPSLAIGFYCKTIDSFQDLVDRLEKLEQEVARDAPLVSITNNADDSIQNVYDLDDNICDFDSISTDKKDDWELL